MSNIMANTNMKELRSKSEFVIKPKSIITTPGDGIFVELNDKYKKIGLFDFKDNHLWEKKYIHASFLNNFNMKEVGTYIYKFQLFTSEFCNELMNICNKKNSWSKGGEVYYDNRISHKIILSLMILDIFPCKSLNCLSVLISSFSLRVRPMAINPAVLSFFSIKYSVSKDFRLLKLFTGICRV